MAAFLSDEDLLGRFVSYDTTSSESNLPLAEFLEDYLDLPGITIERNESPSEPKTNLIVAAGPPANEDRRGLVLSGHMDVVPAREPGWKSDPFTLTRTDHSYIGRGSSDMKGFLALAVNRMRRLDVRQLSHPLMLILTYDEELGTLGAQHLVERWRPRSPLPRAAVIGEPTSLKAIRMHKGHLQIKIEIAGVAAHSGYPHLGHSAITPAARTITKLVELGRRLEAETSNCSTFFPEVPYVALNIGKVQGGTAVNVVPPECEIDVGIRILPEMNSRDVIQRVEEVVRRELNGESFRFNVINDSPPMLLEETAPIYATLSSWIGQETTHSASYATDAGWLQQMGMDCVIFGPGAIEVAHKPNEYMPIGEFKRAGDLLDRLIHEFCLES